MVQFAGCGNASSLSHSEAASAQHGMRTYRGSGALAITTIVTVS
jgi:hypothetical protein